MRDTPDGESVPLTHRRVSHFRDTSQPAPHRRAERVTPAALAKRCFTTRRTTPSALPFAYQPSRRRGGVPPLARRRAAVEGSPDPSPSEPAPPPREVVTPPRWLRPPRIFVRRTPRRRGEWSPRRRGESRRAAHRRPADYPRPRTGRGRLFFR